MSEDMFAALMSLLGMFAGLAGGNGKSQKAAAEQDDDPTQEVQSASLVPDPEAPGSVTDRYGALVDQDTRTEELPATDFSKVRLFTLIFFFWLF